MKYEYNISGVRDPRDLPNKFLVFPEHDLPKLSIFERWEGENGCLDCFQFRRSSSNNLIEMNVMWHHNL